MGQDTHHWCPAVVPAAEPCPGPLPCCAPEQPTCLLHRGRSQQTGLSYPKFSFVSYLPLRSLCKTCALCSSFTTTTKHIPASPQETWLSQLQLTGMSVMLVMIYFHTDTSLFQQTKKNPKREENNNKRCRPYVPLDPEDHTFYS